MVLCGKSARAGPRRYWPTFDSRRVVSAEASAALHSAGALRQDQAATTSERNSEASLSFSTTHFFESVLFGFCFRSFKSLLRPKACLLATRSSREMKFTGTPKKVLATLFLHASGNSTPVISVRMSTRTNIRGCFDNISHEWLMTHIPMDRSILRKWLKAGYMEKSIFHATERGTPQGGIISPVLANLALDGLERCLREKYPQRGKGIRERSLCGSPSYPLCRRHAGTDINLMGCKSPDPNRPFGDLAGGRVGGASQRLK